MEDQTVKRGCSLNLSHPDAAKTNRLPMPGRRLVLVPMANWRRTFLHSPKLLLPAVLVFAGVDAAGIYLLANSTAPEAPRPAPPPPKPKEPPPPAMITPPAVASMLRSGTLIVISKKSQNMFVFSDGTLWASTPISTGKRRHETPSGVFPILQKRKFHRSNIYSNAPMPFMQRLTWDGIALHAGRVPGYAASHGCVRMPHEFAQSLFKLTNASKTTVVIGDDPFENEVNAQQFALTAKLRVFAALAPPPSPAELAGSATTMMRTAFASVGLPAPFPAQAQSKLPSPSAPVPPPLDAAPTNASPSTQGQTIQLAAAASRAEADAHWARLLRTRPDLSRFEKRVESATVNSRPVSRLRISGPDAHGVCAKLSGEGLGCFEVR